MNIDALTWVEVVERDTSAERPTGGGKQASMSFGWNTHGIERTMCEKSDLIPNKVVTSKDGTRLRGAELESAINLALSVIDKPKPTLTYPRKVYP